MNKRKLKITTEFIPIKQLRAELKLAYPPTLISFSYSNSPQFNQLLHMMRSCSIFIYMTAYTLSRNIHFALGSFGVMFFNYFKPGSSSLKFFTTFTLCCSNTNSPISNSDNSSDQILINL